MSPYFPSFAGPEFRAFWASLKTDLEKLAEDFSVDPVALSEESLVLMILRQEDLGARLRHVSSYIGCLRSADTSHEGYARSEGELNGLQAVFERSSNGLLRVLGALDEERFAVLTGDPRLEGLSFVLQEQREEAQYRLPAAEENLASELSISGTRAWSRLYFTVAGELSFVMKTAEGERRVPMAERTGLLADPDRMVRRAAFEGSNAAWESFGSVCAGALNSLSGGRLLMGRKRGQDDIIEQSCRQARVSRGTLEAMLAALEARRSFARSAFRLRCELAGIEDPRFYDLHSPIQSPEGGEIDWAKGVSLIQTAFDNAYPQLGAFFREVIANRWVDYSPRPHRRPGGFCSSTPLLRQSRIFMTYGGSIDGISTLAHEVGHAWHSRNLSELRPLQSSYPMTLAETASTFAERILIDGILEGNDVGAEDRRRLVDMDSSRLVAYLLDLPSRYAFETRFYEERRQGEVSVKRLGELMAETQREVFGESLVEDGLDPWAWCSKLHYYIHGIFLYNYPYTFGFLLSLAIYNRFRQEGASFLSHYEQFLAQSGSDSCEAVVRNCLGEDIEQVEFWAAAVDSLKASSERLKAHFGGGQD